MKKLDLRYSINKEFCGYPEKKYVLRFCGEFLGSFEKRYQAVKAGIEHKEDGKIEDRSAYYQYRKNFSLS